jgi:adenylate kinase
MNVLLLGAQGSGKGTQAQKLHEELHLTPLASGELLREEIARGTPNGRSAQSYYDRGDLVPDSIIVSMILDRMARLEGSAGIILDGFPRTIAQAQVLDKALAERGQQIDRVIYLDVPRELLLDRLHNRYVCRAMGHVYNLKTNPPRVPGICDIDGSELYLRSDDAETAKIQRRLDIFFNETIHLVDYYGKQGKLILVDGTRGIDEVNREILAALAALAALGAHASAQEGRSSERDGDPLPQ